MKQKLLIPLAGLLAGGALLMPSIGLAQSSTSTSAQINALTALLQRIQALQSQINALKEQQATLGSQTATEFKAFISTLKLGSKGDAVTALQTLLAANPNIYPEGLITGNFGRATERALKKLQKENGLEGTGSVGPRTLKLLNRLLEDNHVAFEDREDDEDGDREDGDNRGHGRRPCVIVAPGHLIAPGWLRKHDGAKPIVPECQKLPKGIEDREDDRKGSTTTPDTVAPVISSVSATSTASTTASIAWSTNEKATSILWYSTSTPLVLTSATRIDNNSLKTAHSYNLSGLMASTTYYYTIQVSDKSSNTSTSGTNSVITRGD